MRLRSLTVLLVLSPGFAAPNGVKQLAVPIHRRISTMPSSVESRKNDHVCRPTVDPRVLQVS